VREHRTWKVRRKNRKSLKNRKGRPRGWVGRPVKRCSPPNEVARSPPDDSALRMHVALNPGAAAQRPARNLKQESHTARVEKKS
jgi:hypothetical protein